MQEHSLNADLLIVGGGVAGLNAALSAAEKGASVIIMDKAVIERSGHTAGGIDHFGAFLNTDPEWDTRDAYLAYTVASSRGATRPDVVDRVYCDNLERAIARFERSACPCIGRMGATTGQDPMDSLARGGSISTASG